MLTRPRGVVKCLRIVLKVAVYLQRDKWMPPPLTGFLIDWLTSQDAALTFAVAGYYQPEGL